MKIRWAYARVGSIPTARTTYPNDAKVDPEPDLAPCHAGKFKPQPVAQSRGLDDPR
jgi:hypothetical protein